MVRLNNNSRQDIADVQNLLIATASKEQTPLQQAADVQQKYTPKIKYKEKMHNEELLWL